MTSINNTQKDIQVDTNLSTEPIIPSDKDIKENKEKEISDVIETIDVALKHLGNTIRRIDNFGDWGVFNVFGCCEILTDFIGVKIISNLIEIISSSFTIDNMEYINNELNEANKAIRNINKELIDIKEIVPVKAPDCTFLIDIVIGNTDLKSQSKIAEIESQCKKEIRKLKSIRSELNEYLEQQQKSTSTTVSSKKEIIIKDQETAILEFLELAKPTLRILRKTSHSITKAKYGVGVDLMAKGLSYTISEYKVSKARDRMVESILALKKLDKKLKMVKDIDPKDLNEIPKFIDISEDIINCNKIMFYEYAINKYMKASDSCIGSIIQIKAVIEDLEGRLVKNQKNNNN